MKSNNKSRSYNNKCMSDNNISKAVLAIYYDKRKSKLTAQQFAFVLKYHPDFNKQCETIEHISRQQQEDFTRRFDILEQQIKDLQERYFIKGE